MIKGLVCVCSHETDETLLKNDGSIGEEDFDHSLSHYKKVFPSLPGASLHNVTVFPFVCLRGLISSISAGSPEWRRFDVNMYHSR